MSKKNRDNPEHFEFIRSLPCVNCGKSPSVVAHLRRGIDGGMGLKPSPQWVTPLCCSTIDTEGCHEKQHRIGESEFWGDIDRVKWLCLELYGISGNKAKGNKAINMYRSFL